LFGDGKVNFITTMRRLLGEREALRVVSDQMGCPTYADDLAAVLEFLVTGGHLGVYHATNTGVTTWFDLAREVARCLGTDPARIVACASSEFPTPAVRPANSVLRSRRLEAVGCPDRPTWQDAVARYVARLEAGAVVFP
jgi:dTDP-4-dehydrorhamnose reductase